MNKLKISIVVCCFNEEECLPIIVQSIIEQMNSLSAYDYEIILVDDGSTDHSIAVMRALELIHPQLRHIEFSRNFGHQNALKAGLDQFDGDCVISMDADMQQPPNMIPEFIEKWRAGYEIVYTRRKDRQNIPLFKRYSSKLFYKLLNTLTDTEIEAGTADFRLLDKVPAKVLADLNEDDLFFRGLVKWIGFKQYAIDYYPNDRVKGVSKYTLKKMTALAIRGITSFSVKPLYFALHFGFLVAALSLLYIPYVVYALIYGHPISGWASLIVTIVFFGGVQLCVMGIIGMYLGKLFIQAKQRPKYIVKNSAH